MRNSSNTRPAIAVGLVLALGLATAACSDMYYDRRETVSLGAGDAMNVNKTTHVIDPWPAAAGNRQIDSNGDRMQRAIERYRTNRTTPLATTNTSSVQYQPVLAPAGPAAGPASP